MDTALRGGLRAWLPQGRLLPEAVWRRRHRAIVRLCLTIGVGLVVLAWAWGQAGLTAVAVLAAVAGPLAVELAPVVGRRVRTACTTLSMLAASVALVHLWGGVTESHFAFLVMLGVISVYQDWLPYGIALAVVGAHHGVAGALFPHAVFGQDGAHDPWVWAVVHAVFVLAASLAHVAAWRLNEDQVLSDPLTGLANRTALEDITHRVLQRGGALSVLFIDIDDFKDVNDSRGHAAGDELLQTIAERLRGSVRPGDVVARLGGDDWSWSTVARTSPGPSGSACWSPSGCPSCSTGAR